MNLILSRFYGVYAEFTPILCSFYTPYVICKKFTKICHNQVARQPEAAFSTQAQATRACYVIRRRWQRAVSPNSAAPLPRRMAIIMMIVVESCSLQVQSSESLFIGQPLQRQPLQRLLQRLSYATAVLCSLRKATEESQNILR